MMVWLEFNLHIRNQALSWPDFFGKGSEVLLGLVRPFVDARRTQLTHWHYLVEPDNCRGAGFFEIRLRFEGAEENINSAREALVAQLNAGTMSQLVMRENEPLGSHEGEHGQRGARYAGPRSEDFGRDWDTIVGILEKGSESALAILDLGRGLVGPKSVQFGAWRTSHPYFTHLAANQLLLE